jgi:hypothetical protein
VDAFPVIFKMQASQVAFAGMCPSNPAHMLSFIQDVINNLEDAPPVINAPAAPLMMSPPPTGTQWHQSVNNRLSSGDRSFKPLEECSEKYQKFLVSQMVDNLGGCSSQQDSDTPPPTKKARTAATAQVIVETSKVVKDAFFSMFDKPGMCNQEKLRFIKGSLGQELAEDFAVPVEVALRAKDEMCMSDGKLDIFCSESKVSVMDMTQAPRRHDVVAYRHVMNDTVEDRFGVTIVEGDDVVGPRCVVSLEKLCLMLVLMYAAEGGV